MKNALFLSLLFVGNILNAQYFDSAVHYLTVNCMHVDLGACSHEFYKIVLDSMSNDTEYYSVKSVDANFNTLKKLKVFNKKVFESERFSNKSDFKLIEDFSLAVGDTAYVSGRAPSIFRDSSVYILDSIRPIQLGDRNYTAHYVKVDTHPFVFIDSIGSLENGISFYGFYEFESKSVLVSLCRDNKLLFWRDHFVVKSKADPCSPVFFKSSIDKLKPKRIVRLYPNPGMGVFTFESSAENSEIIVYSMIGKELQHFRIQGDGIIDMSYLPKGNYLLSVLDSFGQTNLIVTID